MRALRKTLTLKKGRNRSGRRGRRTVLPYILVLALAGAALGFAISAAADARSEGDVIQKTEQEEIEDALLVRGLVDEDGLVTLVVPDKDGQQLLVREDVEQIVASLLEGEDVTLAEPGVDGVDGVDGVGGVDGAGGVNGADGANGITGADGVTGAAGEKGEPGAAGAAGEKGETGAVGADGKNGETGAVGADGKNGVDGTNGTNGIKGEKGETGAAGPAGATGPAGEKGETGATGSAGAIGPVGPTGPAGDGGADITTVALSIEDGKLQITITDANSGEVTSEELDLGLDIYATKDGVGETVGDIESDIIGLTDDVGGLETAVDNLKNDVNVLNNTANGKVPALETTVSGIERDLNAITGAIESVGTDIEGLTTAIADLGETYATDDELENAIGTLQTSLDEQIETITDTLGDLPDKYKEGTFADAIDALDTSIENLIENLTTSLLPAYDDNDGKVLGLVDGSLAWVAPEVGGNSYMIPDYSNQEDEVSKISPVNGSSWIVEEDGYVNLRAYNNNDTSNISGSLIIYINDKLVLTTAGLYANDSGVFPVQKGDVISVSLGSDRGTPFATCYYIPPKTVSVMPDDPESDESYVHGQFTSAQGETQDDLTFKPLRIKESYTEVGSALTVTTGESGGTKFTATETGVYNVNFGRFCCDGDATLSPGSRLVIRKFDSGGANIEDVVQIIPETSKDSNNKLWIEANMSYSVLLNEGEYIILGFYDFDPSNVNTGNNSSIALFTIAKL
jgi:uncharacterized protein YoxC